MNKRVAKIVAYWFGFARVAHNQAIGSLVAEQRHYISAQQNTQIIYFYFLNLFKQLPFIWNMKKNVFNIFYFDSHLKHTWQSWGWLPWTGSSLNKPICSRPTWGRRWVGKSSCSWPSPTDSDRNHFFCSNGRSEWNNKKNSVRLKLSLFDYFDLKITKVFLVAS